jgi:transposase, IS5 family
MFNYTPQNQSTLFDFKTEFESHLNPHNRWVQLAHLLDWDGLAKIYQENFSSSMGAKSIDARIVIGALIIKHIECKDDRGTIEMISENVYMQYFLGLDRFSFEPVFDPSLFVTIRKRLGESAFDAMNKLLISKTLNLSTNEDDTDNNPEPSCESAPSNKGNLQLDATVADAHIAYPNDLNLLNKAREKTEDLIDFFCSSLEIEKPRTYRMEARKRWCNLSKKRRKSAKEIRKGVGQQLNYLRRNLKNIDSILDSNPLALNSLDNKSYRYLLIVNELYRQQREMYQAKTHSIAHRIVSIDQPHIRPIVRGKAGRNVEFGAKINVSLQDGFARIDRLDFEAFNEGIYLKQQVERYHQLNGCYPELVQADAIYMNRENRKYLKENNIRHTGRPLGRPTKENLSKYQQRKLKKERGERNHIEGKFGQGKTKYGLNRIMAKLATTSQSWIAAIFFVLNIVKLAKDYTTNAFFLHFWETFYRLCYPKYTPILLKI